MDVRRLLLLSVAWTGVMLVALAYWPWYLPTCARKILRAPDCPADDQMSDAIWWTQTLPLLAFFASGYLILGLLAIRRSRH